MKTNQLVTKTGLIILCAGILSAVPAWKGPDKTSKFDTPFEIGVNENVILPKKELTITLEGVLDNRCPTNVKCFQEGNVTASLKILSKDGNESTAQLCLGNCDTVKKVSDTVEVNFNEKEYNIVLKDVTKIGFNKAVLVVTKD